MFWGGKPEHESSVAWLDPFIVRLGSNPVCNWGVLLRFFIPCNQFLWWNHPPGSKLLILGMVIPPLIGNPCNGYINPYYWVDDHPNFSGTKLTPTNQHLVPTHLQFSTQKISKIPQKTLPHSPRLRLLFSWTPWYPWDSGAPHVYGDPSEKVGIKLASKTTLLWTPPRHFGVPKTNLGVP